MNTEQKNVFLYISNKIFLGSNLTSSSSERIPSSLIKGVKTEQLKFKAHLAPVSDKHWNLHGPVSKNKRKNKLIETNTSLKYICTAVSALPRSHFVGLVLHVTNQKTETCPPLPRFGKDGKLSTVVDLGGALLNISAVNHLDFNNQQGALNPIGKSWWAGSWSFPPISELAG